MNMVYDVAVFGAGVSGICAALQCARLGKRTLLVEKGALPGGAITLNRIELPAIFAVNGKQIIRGIGWELISKTYQAMQQPLPDLATLDHTRHWEAYVPVNGLLFAAVAEEELLKASCDILYFTMPSKLELIGDCWQIELCGKDSVSSCSAGNIIDCTGDADVVKLAGFACEAPEVCQPGTLSVKVSGFDVDNLDCEAMGRNLAAAFERNEAVPADFSFSYPDKLPSPQSLPGIFKHFFNRCGMNANHITFGSPDQPGNRTALEIAARRSMLRAWRFLREQKGLENLHFELASSECGVRESRRIVAEYNISENDYYNGKSYPDAVCYSYYPIDLHDDAVGLIVKPLPDGVLPQIPRGALIPKGSRRLLAAGRIIGSDRMANSALRIQATCMATGQAAGVLAALSDQYHGNISNIPMEKVRQILQKNGAILP